MQPRITQTQRPRVHPRLTEQPNMNCAEYAIQLVLLSTAFAQDRHLLCSKLMTDDHSTERSGNMQAEHAASGKTDLSHALRWLCACVLVFCKAAQTMALTMR